MGFAGKANIGGSEHALASTLYGVCTTAGATAAKVVTCPDFDTLLVGVTIAVKFLYTNTAADPTLNVNGTGAKPIYTDGTNAPGTTPQDSWAANSVVSFVYDGNAWLMTDTMGTALLSLKNMMLSEFLNTAYPVGSLYMSASATNPGTLFGGTWEAISGKFLLAASESHVAGSMGGAETVSLSEANMPSHGHSIPALSGYTSGDGSHSHNMAFVPRRDGYTQNGFGYQYQSSGSVSNDASLNGSGIDYAGAHSHSVATYANNTGYTGSGVAHDNMPPYLAVYVWKRTA